jgi:hypothetical protein
LGEKGMDAIIILNGSQKNKVWGVEWIYLAQDEVQKQAFVDSVIDPYATEKTGCFLTSPGTITFSKMSDC